VDHVGAGLFRTDGSDAVGARMSSIEAARADANKAAQGR